MIKQYIAYLKDNPNHYWFKRKIFGWGWVPVTWQGFAVIIIFVGLIIGIAVPLDKQPQSVSDAVYSFFVPLVVLIILLIGLCYWKGEPPNWQWGIPKKDKNE
jgi:uncharacterized membrane protein YhaH (DUF805 family)